jgi:hypothetical protein
MSEVAKLLFDLYVMAKTQAELGDKDEVDESEVRDAGGITEQAGKPVHGGWGGLEP